MNRLEIEADLESGHISIQPLSSNNFRPASYVLSLGGRFRRWRALPGRAIRLWSEDAAAQFLDEPIEGEDFLLQPGEFALACTKELIGLPADRWAVLSPLSHIARFGLGIHCGADYINPGFGLHQPSQLTLELFNHNASALELKAGMPIAHLRVGRVAPARIATRSIYEGRDPLGAPQYFEEVGSPVERSAAR